MPGAAIPRPATASSPVLSVTTPRLFLGKFLHDERSIVSAERIRVDQKRGGAERYGILLRQPDVTLRVLVDRRIRRDSPVADHQCRGEAGERARRAGRVTDHRFEGEERNLPQA